MTTLPAIRPATPDDSICLRALGTQIFLSTYAFEGVRPILAREVMNAFSEASMEALFAQAEVRMHVAARDDHIVGFTQLIIGKSHDLVVSVAPAKLERIYVQEPFTRGGVGKMLLDSAEAVARSAGASDIWLMCWFRNHRALQFYRKNDFVDCGATYFRMENEQHENRVLVKSLR